MKKVLTIQDISCFGQCSLTVALPLISACQVETVILPGAVLSTHTSGFKHFTFCDLSDEFPKIENSWKQENIKFDAFYTGYVCAGQIESILNIFQSCAAPGALRIVDPVMADNGKMYPGFGPDFPAMMRKLCCGADCILPNLTEAAFLLEREPVLENYDQAYIEELCRGLYGIGAKTVVLTGVSFEADKLGFAVYDGQEFKYYFNKRRIRSSHGTGDVYASIFTGAVMNGYSFFDAASFAADMVCECLDITPEDHWYGVSFEAVIPELVRRLAEKK